MSKIFLELSRKLLSHKSLVKIFGIVLFSAIFALLAIFIVIFLRYWSIPVFFIIFLNALIFISWKKDVSIPLISHWLTKEYIRAKFKLQIFKKEKYYHHYLSILYHLILLFHSSKKSFEVVKHRYEEKNPDPNHPHFFHHCAKQKKTTFFSLAGSGTAILAIVISSWIVYFIFPVFNANAKTYNFNQTSWSGGADTTATSTHTYIQSTAWTKYYAASSTISASSTIQLLGILGSKSQTSFNDFLGGTTSTMLALGYNNGAYLVLDNDKTSSTPTRIEGTLTGTSTLVGYWKMNEAIGNWNGTSGEVKDSSGQGNDGTRAGSASTTNTSILVRAGAFFAYTDHVDVYSNNFAFSKTTPFSGVAWMRSSAAAANSSIISNWNTGTSPGWAVDVGAVTAGTLRFFLTDVNGNSYEGKKGATNVLDGNWHFTVFTYDGSNTKNGFNIYVDAKPESLVDAVSGSQDPGTLANNSFEIGARRTANFGFNGQIDDVRMYNKVLTPSEINSLYNAQYAYYTSGNFTSSIMDFGSTNSFTTSTWTTSTPVGTTQTFKVRTSNNSDMSGATAFTSCNAIVQGQDISTNNCVTNGQRYLQYFTTFTSNTGSSTPELDDITFNYYTVTYPATSTIISSPFDSEQDSNVVSNLTWTENLPAGTDVKFQIRTSADGVTWGSWLGPTGTGDYYSNPAGNTINSQQTDGVNDRFVQYQAWLTSNGSNTPTLSNITLQYVVNAPPEFQAAPTSTQRASDGYIQGGYSIRDPDTASSGVGCPLCVDNLVFAYSTNGGSSWTNITSGLSTGATSTKTVGTTSYTNYQFTWNAQPTLNGTVTSTMMMRITVDDKEGANNTATSSTAAFSVDYKAPTAGALPIRVMATSTPALLQLSASDDSAFQMCITLDNTVSNCATYNTTSTISLTTDPATVYVRFRDAYQNTSASYNVSTPETPTLILLKDVSNIATGDYREFVAWKTVAAPFNNYKVLRSSDGGNNYSVITKITDRLLNYYIDTGLTASSTYYYVIATEDGNGNVSYSSASLHDVVNGQGGTDITPPTISNVALSTSTPQSAIIVWDTDELANSTVKYSSSPGSFSLSIGVATMKDTSSSAGQHSVAMTNLSPNTAYYYQVQSADPSGNTATSSTSPNGFSFTTPSGPKLSNVTAQSINNNSATIIWNTDTSSNSLVTYSTSSALQYTLTAGSDSESVVAHLVNLTGLSASTTYYYYAKSGIGNDNNGGSYYSFITSNDTTPPNISNINISLKIDTKAVFSWTTNKDANTSVAYSTTSGSYTNTTSTLSSYTTDHNIRATNLTAKTKYYYIVVSGDRNGNFTTSTEGNFTTQETLSTASEVAAAVAAAPGGGVSAGSFGAVADTTPPTLSNVKVEELGDTLATVKWLTNEESDSFVEYGDNPIYGNIFGNSFSRTYNHALTLQNLKPDTKYYYRASSKDASGNLGQSNGDSFTTLKAGVKADTKEVAKAVAPEAKETPEQEQEKLIAAAKSAFDALRALTSKVSIAVAEPILESELKDLTNSVPSPILSGEPRVIVTDSTALVTWQTDKTANSLVSYVSDKDYNPATKAYAETVGNSEEAVQNHAVTLMNLEPDTIYHFQVVSKSLTSGVSKSQDFIFRTKTKELEITNYVVENVSSEKAIFRWVTSAETNSMLQFAPYRNGVLAVDESKTKKDGTMTTLHQLEVDGLEFGVSYEVNLSGTDIGGKTVSRKISAFSTSQSTLPPLIFQVQTDSALSPGKESRVQTIISYMTDQPTVGFVYYKKGAGEFDENTWEKTPIESGYSKKHVSVITKFDPGAIYRFRIKATDSSGNAALSQVFTILAPRQKETVFQVIVSNIEKTFSWTKRLGL